MILNSVWYIVKGVKKTFSLAVYKWFHQMNIKLSWIESNDYFSCHSNFKSFVLFPISPPRFKLKKEQRPEELWTEVILDFCIVTIHERLSGLELLAISWQRTPSPGLTVKGGRNVLNALHSVCLCLSGGGVSKQLGLQWKAAAISWPRAKTFALTRSTKPVSSPQAAYMGKPTTASAFQPPGLWKPVH